MTTEDDTTAEGAGRPAPSAPAPAAPAAPGRTGGTTVTIHTMSGGSVATGEHGRAESVNQTVQAPDPAHQKLLEAVRELRRLLPPQDGPEAGGELDAELAVVEGQITRQGRAPRELLARLLGRLAAYGPAAGTAASVAAVIQALAPLLS